MVKWWKVNPEDIRLIFGGVAFETLQNCRSSSIFVKVCLMGHHRKSSTLGMCLQRRSLTLEIVC
jgi:hypothetical protein